VTGSTYPINVFWSDEEQSWVAEVPDLAFCSASGRTPHEAVAEVEMAIKAWVHVAQSSGRELPEPSPRPSTQHSRRAVRA